MFILILLCALMLILLFYKLFKIYNYWSAKGVTHINLLHCFKNFTLGVFRITKSSEFIKGIYDKHKNERYVGFYEYFHPILLIKDPELVKEITVTNFKSFTDHNDYIPSMDLNTLWSKNLFGLSSESGWSGMKSVITPFFTTSKLSTMFPLIKECAENCLNDINRTEGKIIVPVKDISVRYTNDVIASTAFGISCDSFTHKNNDFFKMTKSVIAFTRLEGLSQIAYTLFPRVMNLLNVQSNRPRASKFFKEVFLESVKIRNEEKIVRPDLINLLMQAGFQNGFLPVKNKSNINLTEDDCVAQAIVFIIAGVETVSHVLSYVFYELAINPRVQEKLHEEIFDTLRENKGVITYSTLHSMKYLDNVITEGLRVHPPSAVIDRKCMHPYTIKAKLPHEKDIHLKRNDWVWISSKAIHCDPIHYLEPEKFNPDRFNDDNLHQNRLFTLLAFGAGPRSCIGERFAIVEMKIFIVTILQWYKLTPWKNTGVNYDDKIFLQLHRKNEVDWLSDIH